MPREGRTNSVPARSGTEEKETARGDLTHHGRTDGRMNAWMDGWADGWMVGWREAVLTANQNRLQSRMHTCMRPVWIRKLILI